MEWSEDAIVLVLRRHGENDAIVSVLARGQGRYSGLVRGGAGRRAGPVYQPGNRIAARWRARLDDQLGALTAELVHGHAARLMGDADRLSALVAAAAVADAALPDREPHPLCFDGLADLLARLDAEDAWPAAYVCWERDLLAELGFGLDLERCAVTGSREELRWVSPRSGRAVSAAAGAAYADRLLRLPPFLLADGVAGAPPADVLDGLRLTGRFLENHVFAALGRAGAPAARGRLVDRIARLATMGGGESPQRPQNLQDS
ncbi:DNA replication and repair protein RecO [Stella humosa]|uniref:DNA repair protein RecO n=1 Tax=Stella humosa TaxID=94 RepID=A0A3N1KR04_9PROT|nr:DNA repair protein RecO [Stella humosa]ROP81229.1 DNA replication and repair protein RecO [Stella humosa]BBK32577.1 DNA repair protein RecO [Stella humosa]